MLYRRIPATAKAALETAATRSLKTNRAKPKQLRLFLVISHKTSLISPRILADIAEGVADALQDLADTIDQGGRGYPGCLFYKNAPAIGPISEGAGED